MLSLLECHKSESASLLFQLKDNAEGSYIGEESRGGVGRL